MSKQWYFTSFAAAQIAREVEKSERIRAKEASSLNEPSTSTVCTCSSIWIGQTYLTVVINICYCQSLIQSWIPEKVFNFQTSKKVWKIEIKSWKNGKKSFIVTTSALQEKFFCADQILFNLACTLICSTSWKKHCSIIFFKVSIDHLFDNFEFVEKLWEKSRICIQKCVWTLYL